MGSTYVLDYYVFDTSTITWGTVVALAFFFLGLSLLFVVYTEYQHKMYSLGVKIAVIVIYLILGGYLVIDDLIKGESDFETDATCMDIWTAVHFLAGPFFAILLPHWWMLLVVSLWE
eukprot:314691_1